MSKLDELIRELCPDGVETFPLEECCNILDKKRKPVTKNSREKGEYPYYGANGVQDYVSDYIFNGKFVLVGEDGSVITKSGTPVVTWAEGKIWVNNHAHVIEEKSGTMLRYLYFYIQTIDVTSLIHGNIPKLTGRDFRSLKIALPPLEIQREIVSILDNFTNLTAELAAKLTAEFTARQRQYEFYRDKLLTFDVLKEGTINFCQRTLGEMFDFRNGLSKGKEFFGKGTPFIRYTDVYNHRTLRKKDITALVECTEDEKERLKVSRGDVLFTRTSETAEDIGWSSVMLDDMDDCVFNGFTIKATPKTKELLPEYCAYCFSTSDFRQYVTKHCAFTTRASLTGNTIAQYRMTIPPLDIQSRIVNVLDNFEKICSDLNIGLPAEIEARQKQYEYYRDKLLTFAETGNTILSRAEQSRALIKLLQYVFGYAVVSLQDVVKNSCSGGTPKKGVSEYYEDGNIPWLRTQEVVFRDICKTECFITESAVKNSAAKWIPENCVIVAISGATAGRCAINKIPLTTNQHCLNLEVDPEMALYRYVYYCICAKQEELLAKKEGARGDLNSTRILSLQIDLPSIEKQKRIVSILDRFDAICNDLTSGLPAEIEARQKQYEYYRDKLLTFKEVAAT